MPVNVNKTNKRFETFPEKTGLRHTDTPVMFLRMHLQPAGRTHEGSRARGAVPVLKVETGGTTVVRLKDAVSGYARNKYDRYRERRKNGIG